MAAPFHIPPEAFDTEDAPFASFKPERLSRSIGAILHGADLKNLNDILIQEVRTALLKYQVVFFRDQFLSDEQQIAFAKSFGPLEIHPVTPKDQENPEILHIKQKPGRPASENMWHSDVTWRPEPSLGSVLQAVELPPLGGDTLFSNMHLAYETLTDEDKDALCKLTAKHDIARVFGRRLGMTIEEIHEKFPIQQHPVVRTHPETGQRVIYINNAFTSEIVGMSDEDSKALIHRMERLAARPELQCRFKWEPGSIAFWDNRICQHYASNDYFPHQRHMARVTIAGDRPFFRA